MDDLPHYFGTLQFNHFLGPARATRLGGIQQRLLYEDRLLWMG